MLLLAKEPKLFPYETKSSRKASKAIYSAFYFRSLWYLDEDTIALWWRATLELSQQKNFLWLRRVFSLKEKKLDRSSEVLTLCKHCTYNTVPVIIYTSLKSLMKLRCLLNEAKSVNSKCGDHFETVNSLNHCRWICVFCGQEICEKTPGQRKKV